MGCLNSKVGESPSPDLQEEGAQNDVAQPAAKDEPLQTEKASTAAAAETPAAEAEAAGPQGKRVVIIGAGFGGLTAAKALSALADEGASVTIVDKRTDFAIGGEFQYVMTGRRKMEELPIPLSKATMSEKIVRMFGTEVKAVDTDAKEVTVSPADGGADQVLGYDFLVLAAGISSAPHKLEGAQGQVLDICNPEDTEKIGDAVRALKGGETVVVMTSAVPYKCPPAPFEYAFLIDGMMREQGVREACKIIVTTPKGPFPFGNPTTAKVFKSTMEEKGIEFRAGIKPKAVLGDDKVVRFGPFPPTEGGEETEIGYDLLVGTVPQVPHAVFAPLCNEKGFVAADVVTMETKFDGVFAVGDVSWMMLPTEPPKPHPKAGGFAVLCAENASAMINALARGKTHAQAVDSVPKGRKAECYAESGLDTGILVGPKLLADADGPMGFRCEGPAPEWHQAKAEWLAAMKATFFGSNYQS